ncbi:MAG TPA: hypothetical protein VN969_14110 [Streptosporangiaceae bacterium]|nr:hypothetical protein [Streptosporangiaceae bacterium]
MRIREVRATATLMLGEPGPAFVLIAGQRRQCGRSVISAETSAAISTSLLAQALYSSRPYSSIARRGCWQAIPAAADTSAASRSCSSAV